MDLAAAQARIIEDIRKYGCHVIQVQGNGPHPSFAYSVGIGRTSDSPDVCVFGLPAPSAHRLLHHYNKSVREGERFESGQVLPGYIKNAECVLRPVDPSHHQALFGFNVWLRQQQPILENVSGPH